MNVYSLVNLLAKVIKLCPENQHKMVS